MHHAIGLMLDQMKCDSSSPEQQKCCTVVPFVISQPTNQPTIPRFANFEQTSSVRLEAVFLYLTIARHESHTYGEEKYPERAYSLFSGSLTSLALVQHLLETATDLSAQLFRDFPLGQRSDCPSGECSYFSIFALNRIFQRKHSQFFITLVFYATDGKERGRFYKREMFCEDLDFCKCRSTFHT